MSDATTPTFYQTLDGGGVAPRPVNNEAQAPGGPYIVFSGPPKNVAMDPLLFSAPL